MLMRVLSPGKPRFMTAGGAPAGANSSVASLRKAQYSRFTWHHCNGMSAFQLNQAPAGAEADVCSRQV